MVQRDLRPAALAAVRLILRTCGWLPIYESAQDVITIAGSFVGKPAPPPPKDIKRIVNWILKGLTSVLESEYSSLPDNDVNAAAIAVSRVLELPVRDDLLISAVTDSSALESQLLRHGGEKIRQDLLSEPAISVFDILLRSACRHLAEVTLTAPEFGPLALRQLLRNQAQLDKISKQIAESLDRLALPPETNQDFIRFTERYMARISEQLDYLDIPGIDLDRFRQRYNLTMAYIPMRTQGDEVQNVEISSVETITGLSDYLYIVGEPGSGKSTLLKWAAVQTARLKASQPSQRRTVPFLIKLRALSDTRPDLDEFGAPMTQALVISKPANWSQDLIASGRALLLFDGLDEIPEYRREIIVKWIDQIYEDHSRRGTRIIVTTRQTAISEARFRSRYASYTALQPMQQGKIERFVYLWHHAVYSSVETVERSHWLATSDQLLARLENDPQLARLASNPLLCAVICALYHARNQHLPSERFELYEALLAMLLARRDAERQNIDTPLSLTDVQRLARLVAQYFLQHSRDELPQAEILEVIRGALANFRNFSVRDLRPRLVLDHFVGRTGVLRQLPPEGAIEFWHKSFQEFLAAQMLVSGSEDQNLVNHAADAQWREVIIWSCSLMPMERASSLINEILLLADDAPSESERNYLTSVALSCAHFTVQLSEGARLRIDSCASRLIPPTSYDQLETILQLGAAAVPFLYEFLALFEEEELSSNDEEVLELIIYALTRIGGEESNSALWHMSARLKATFALLLAQGWSYSGSADYARRVLGTIPTPDKDVRVTVEIQSLRQLRSIDYLSPIYRPRVELSFADIERHSLGSGSSKDIAVAAIFATKWEDALFFLDRYSGVEEIRLQLQDNTNAIEDNARNFPNIRSLVIVGESKIVVHIDHLHIFPNLQSVDVFGPVKLVARNGFGAHPNLDEVSIELIEGGEMDVLWEGLIEVLSVASWPYSSIEPLRNMRNLNELNVAGSTTLRTLEGVQYLPNLQSLDVSDCINLEDAMDLTESSVLYIDFEGCDKILASDIEQFYAEIGFESEELGLLTADSPTPSALADRWNYPELGDLSEGELEVRGWNDDWWFWEEIKGDADEWEAPDPTKPDEISLREENITIYNSMEEWRSVQEREIDDDPLDRDSWD
jgi:hypothetical protein